MNNDLLKEIVNFKNENEILSDENININNTIVEIKKDIVNKENELQDIINYNEK